MPTKKRAKINSKSCACKYHKLSQLAQGFPEWLRQAHFKEYEFTHRQDQTDPVELTLVLGGVTSGQLKDADVLLFLKENDLAEVGRFASAINRRFHGWVDETMNTRFCDQCEARIDAVIVKELNGRLLDEARKLTGKAVLEVVSQFSSVKYTPLFSEEDMLLAYRNALVAELDRG
jgi:hypothetical protein